MKVTPQINLLILGADGMLGNCFQRLQKSFNAYQFFFKNKQTLDITGSNEIENTVKEHNIHVIVNCAAYTNVNETINQLSIANQINGDAVGGLANLAKKLNLQLVHFSTDYVFDGTSKQLYKESDEVNPINDYGKSKLLGELLMKKINPDNSVIIRTSWLYDAYGVNFLTKILSFAKEKQQLSIVNDQYGSPTYATDLALNTLKIVPLLKNEGVETYHFSNTGICTWYEFAMEFINIHKLPCKIVPVSSNEFPSKVLRPKWSVLDTNLIQQKFNLQIPTWKYSVKQCMKLIMNDIS